MQFQNYFKLHEFGPKNFIKVILFIQISFLCLIVLDFNFDFKIPILKNLIGFVFTIFIPGTLLLRILNMENLNSLKSFLLTVGLSISFFIFLGFLMNLIHVSFNFNNSLSFWNLIITSNIIITVLLFLSYNKHYDTKDNIINVNLLEPQLLFLVLIPFISIIGTYIMNQIHDNSILLILIPMVGSILILTSFNKISRKYYPLAIFSISLSLLFHNSLISAYVTGWDIQFEYGLINNVIQNGFWNQNILSDYNSMLSIVILGPIYSAIIDLSIDQTLKIIYPFIFSLVPLGLYEIYRVQTDEKISFFSVFLYVSFFTYILEMTALARQEIASFFYMLIILLVVSANIKKPKNALLIVIFLFSLVLSHYALSYIFIITVIMGLIILYLTKNGSFFIKTTNRNHFQKVQILNLNFILTFIVISFAWYMYTSGSSILETVVTLGNHFGSNILSIMDPNVSQGYSILIKQEYNIIAYFHKVIQLLVQFFIIIGIVISLIKYKTLKINKEYFILAISNILIAISGIILPYVSNALNTSRLYHINLILLAPFAILGGIYLLNKIQSFLIKKRNYTIISLKILSIFLVIFLLFNSTWINAISKDISSSISFDNDLNTFKYNKNEIIGSNWLSENKNLSKIYSDRGMHLIFGRNSENPTNFFVIYKGSEFKLPDNSYFFLGRYNIINNEIYALDYNDNQRKNISINSFNTKMKIYDNGDVRIFI